MTTDDRELVRRFQRGEPGSFEALYDQYGNRVYRFCFRLCGHVGKGAGLCAGVADWPWSGCPSLVSGRS